MLPTTSPTANLSRSRLKALSKWVRDELDIRVAREGPNILRPDDVLILHETFEALCYATDITALDLRATGIHRAVQDIAGVATRWPGRLCDDCDKIISIWTARFGPLNELHPFLYGRGGRLEGVASMTQYSREALLKRWSEQCPEKLHPKRSHKLGDLGFRAGDWWINTLFAHHAGIIGLEAIEGGTTFDKHGAYALVLKDTGEVEAYDGNSFTYRVPQWDKGKFRLTAATRRSREPIRVLRSHSINSMWGPKAGVRYEGLYSVKGWSISQAKSADIAGGQWKEGDLLFDVRFARNDPMPFSHVDHRPTATELDDYAEYKRLRKFHREGKRNAGLTIDLSNMGPQRHAKAAPPIAPAAAPILLQPTPTAGTGVAAPKIIRKGSPRKKKHLHFELPVDRRSLKGRGSPVQVPKVQSLFTSPASFKANDTDYFSSTPSPAREASNLAVSAGSGYSQPRTPSPPKVNFDLGEGMSPATSSELTAASAQKNILEVAPWIDFDTELPVPEEDEVPLSRQISLKVSPIASANMRKGKQRHEKESPPLSPWSNRRKSGGMGRLLLLTPGGRKGDQDPGSRKSIFRSKNPMAKHLDGAGDTANDEEEPVSPKSQPQRTQASSSEGIRVVSPMPIRPYLSSPESPFALGRRDAIYTHGLDDDDEISPIETHSATFSEDNEDDNDFAPLPTNTPSDRFSPSPTHTVHLPSTNNHSLNFSPAKYRTTTSFGDHEDPFTDPPLTDPPQSPLPTTLVSRATTSVDTSTQTAMEKGELATTEDKVKSEKVVFNFPDWGTRKAKEKKDRPDDAPDEA